MFVTNDRRPVFTDAMLACCANTMQPSARNLVELVEFNGEADHVDLLVAYPANPGKRQAGATTQRTYVLAQRRGYCKGAAQLTTKKYINGQ